VKSKKPENVRLLIERLQSLPDATPAAPIFPTGLMAVFVQPSADCGTVGCIAGEIALMTGKYLPTVPVQLLEDRAGEFLGLTYTEAESVFYTWNWPLDLRRDYYETTNRPETAESWKRQRELMIERLKRLL
jgi:hypothetical protein